MNPLRWRKMSWALLAFTGIAILFIVAYAVSGTPESCSRSESPEACELGADTGRGVGIALVFCLWVIGFAVLSVIWFMTKPAQRVCPACGTVARRKELRCRQCGFDFQGAVIVGPRSN